MYGIDYFDHRDDCSCVFVPRIQTLALYFPGVVNATAVLKKNLSSPSATFSPSIVHLPRSR